MHKIVECFRAPTLENTTDTGVPALGIRKRTSVHHFTSKDRMLAESHEADMPRRLTEAEIILTSLNLQLSSWLAWSTRSPRSAP